MSIIWDLTIGDLFRIDNYWYRLNKFDGSDAVLNKIGTNAADKLPIKLPVETEITELSVLNTK